MTPEAWRSAAIGAALFWGGVALVVWTLAVWGLLP
jgi:hypothetical protein